ncbi:MAG: gliding motility protein GldN, partial [Bacteroidota bacterium]
MRETTLFSLVIYVLLAVALPELAAGQADPCQANNLDPGPIPISELTTAKPIPYTPLREADVMWSRRIWRRIDLRQKLNHPLYYPENPVGDRWSLFDVLQCAILNRGTITAYDPGPLGDNDMFTAPMTAMEVEELLITTDTIPVINLQGEQEMVPVTERISSRDIRFYDIKEEWFFDRQRSVMDVRIIGICPMVIKRDETTGAFRGYKPLFWVYYPEARHTLANYKAYLPHNDIDLWSYDDLFWKRRFNSYIVKRSNV